MALAQRQGVSEIVGRVLLARGFDNDTAPGFLEPRLRDLLPDPSHLLDLDLAVERLVRAVRAGERIGIIGDYDVDGATSTALMARWLRPLGIDATILIPDRLTEGYGASEEAFAKLAEAGCRLVLTLDNGTTAFSALAAARDLGQEVIVVDHHAVEQELPTALAVINPNRRDQESPLRHLAAVGVTFVLLVAANRELRRSGWTGPVPEIMELLDLVAFGTICDVVPLEGINRAFVRQGLKLAMRGGTQGLAALSVSAGIGRIEDSAQFGFVLGPRINAAGRLGQSLLGAELLTTDDPHRAETIAKQLEVLNTTRQAIEREVLALAMAAVQPQLEADAALLVAAGRGWHVGVLGIVASRLVERYGRPTFVIALDGEVGKGSGRSVPGLDLGALVIEARHAGHLTRSGGHAMAAGLTLDAAKLEEFQAFATARGRADLGASGEDRGPVLLDGAMSVAGLTVGLAADLQRLAPFGPGNSEPRFCLTDASLVNVREVGNGHVSCIVTGAGTGRAQAIAFRARDRALGRLLLESRGPVRLAGQVRLDRYRGEEKASFRIDDAAPG